MLFDRSSKPAPTRALARFFPRGRCPPVVELLHALREGERDRVLIASMIERLIDAGADVVRSHPEVYLPEPHPRTRPRRRDFGIAGDDKRPVTDQSSTNDPMDTNGSDVEDAESALGRSARRQAASFVDARVGRWIGERVVGLGR